jgi:(1->4)-alpha-D-glucan 1-alpha-D-glucosylmutase
VGASAPRRVPVSSYRLQLNPGFTLFDAAALVPYLAALGITECYASPVLAARPSSLHGYDICDHDRLNPELGGEAGFAAFAAATRAHDLGILLDFVPNHMSTHPVANRWWRSVLENGPSSPYAAYFDIDWDPVKPELKGKILLPVLGDQYGVTLDSGLLRLELADGAFRLRYHDLDLPLNPRQLRLLLEHGLDALKRELSPDDPDLTEFLSVLFHLEHLPPYTEIDPRLVAERWREKEVALGRLLALLERAPRVRRHVEDNLRLFNGTPGEPASFDLLHALLDAQPYRLASWRTAMHEINYRRFFDVNELAGIRMEDAAVFAAAHEQVAHLVADGSVTGLRLDHVDGLFDPADYLQQLAARLGPEPPVWTMVEKVLSAGERLDDGWLVHGTTGYDFLNSVNGLFVDPARAETFAALSAAFVGERRAFPDVAYASKKLIITTSMASELNVLAHELNRISESDRRFRDFTLDSLQEALRETVACFPVYRSYFRGTEPTPFDLATVDRAITVALRRNPALEPTIFQFIQQMLLPGAAPGVTEPERARRRRFAMKFQQYTGPVQAKGVEDTAFYRYGPLLSLNEVGGDPTRFGQSVAAFHAENRERLRHWPLSMLATGTHDTKRGEDARARLNVLSELPRRWRVLLRRWSRVAASARATVQDRPAPSSAEEYHFYQALVGAWPPGVSGPPGPAFVERLQAYMLKAMREAKVHTSWINPSAEYERAVLEFVRAVLAGPVCARFSRSFAPFAARVAWFGMLNSLAQLVLKLGSPGVPDFYQGTELWDLSLVDPDNRRPVDYAHRRRLLAELAPLVEAAGRGGDGRVALDAVQELLRSWTDGRIKMYVTRAGLALRRRHAPLFLEGEYLPLPAEGERSDHVVAFARQHGGRSALVLAPRLVVGLTGEAELPVGTAVWGDTALRMPAGIAPGDYRSVLTGEGLRLDGNSIPVASVLTTLPVGLWIGPSGA